MTQGDQTRAFGQQLAAAARAASTDGPWAVYYDHGDPKVDASVAATKGFYGQSVANLNRLTDIDILVSRGDVAELLIEVEERACSPKKVLGAVLATLLCNGFAVRVSGRQQTFVVSPTTRLIVAGVVPDRGARLGKMRGIVAPRIQQLTGLPDTISPANVELLFHSTLAATMSGLRRRVAKLFPWADHVNVSVGGPHTE